MSPLNAELPHERLITDLIEVERVARGYALWRPYDVARVAELTFPDALLAARLGRHEQLLGMAGALVALAQVSR